MRRLPPARLALIALAGLAGAALCWGGLQPGGLVLSVTPVQGGAPLLQLPLMPGQRFTLRYVHSVDKAPIWEEHSVGATGEIYVEEERLVMFGAGMGELPGRGRLTGRGSLQVIEGMHWPLGSFVLRVGSPGVDHTIVWDGGEMNLSALAPGQAVVVSARPVNLAQKLWRRLAAMAGRAHDGSETRK